MTRNEKLRLIRGLVLGSINPLGLKGEVEVWMQQPDKTGFKNIKSGEISDLGILKQRESLFGSSRLIIVEFQKGKTIL
jgi:hypothetical protein